MKEKKFLTMGIVISVLIVFLGILTMANVFCSEISTIGNTTLYDHGYSAFGADFYTYVSNNAADAASTSRTTAKNVILLISLIKTTSGLFLCSIGAMGFCYFSAAAAKVQAAEPASPEVGTNAEAEDNEESK